MKTKPKLKALFSRKPSKEHTVTHFDGSKWQWCPAPYPDAVNALLASGKTGELDTSEGRYRVQ